jgi:hypothetical protein
VKTGRGPKHEQITPQMAITNHKRSTTSLILLFPITSSFLNPPAPILSHQPQPISRLIPLPMRRRRRPRHHRQTSRIHTKALCFSRLRLLFFLSRNSSFTSRIILVLLYSLLLLPTLEFLVRKFDFLDGVAGALFVQFLVLGDAVGAVSAATGAVGGISIGESWRGW